ncbi:hypothetical protein ACFQHO_50660 [Actinomadura yumaensis]|uniref:hypothetical protein n=1 Tax=Actinomadura yumaensis TaxID=111807 RepID=UPI0036127FEF
MSTMNERWAVPAVSVGIGVVMCLAVGLNGTWWLGFLLLGIMVVYAAVLLLFRGAEPVALLGGEGRTSAAVRSRRARATSPPTSSRSSSWRASWSTSRAGATGCPGRRSPRWAASASWAAWRSSPGAADRRVPCGGSAGRLHGRGAGT